MLHFVSQSVFFNINLTIIISEAAMYWITKQQLMEKVKSKKWNYLGTELYRSVFSLSTETFIWFFSEVTLFLSSAMSDPKI